VNAAPFVKWAGGKRRLLPQLLARLPRRMTTYFEPFVGGGAVFFALANERRFERAVLGDDNAELIEVYRVVRDDPETLVRALKPMQKHVRDAEYFYRVRASSPRLPVRRAARFLFLNKTCFNGLYRVNKAGHFNVPFGRYKTPPQLFDPEALHDASRALQNVELVVGDFATTLEVAARGDAVYLDPPYAPRSETSRFTSYTTGGFGAQDHERLADTFARLKRRRVRAVLSNASTLFTRALFEAHEVEVFRVGRTISAAAKRRAPVDELIVTHRSRRRRRAS
jgi:DNA adenine methylase